MKHKKIISCCVLSLFCACSVPFIITNSKKIEEVRADEEELVTIGRFALTEPVSVRTKEYIDNFSDIAFIESTGRTVYEEPYFPIINPEIMSTNFHIIRPFTDYYYYSSPTSDRITEIVDLKNDIYSVITVVEYLEEKADDFGLTGSNKVNAILGYIRTINSNYNNNSNIFHNYFGIVGGEINEQFISYVESDNTRGIKPNEYFANLLENENHYSNIHSAIRSGYSLPNQVLLDDPLSSTGYMDIVHMFASMDGIYENTGASFLNDVVFPNNEQQDLVSWAGDLQSVINQIEIYQDIINGEITNFNDVMNFTYTIINGESITNGSSSFKYCDYSSDLDAYIIAKNFLDSGYDISESLSSYYSVMHTNQARKNIFAGLLIEKYDEGNYEDREWKIREIIYRFAGIKIKWNNGNPTYSKYISIFFRRLGMYKLLLDNDTNPTLETRLLVAECMVQYFL